MTIVAAGAESFDLTVGNLVEPGSFGTAAVVVVVAAVEAVETVAETGSSVKAVVVAFEVEVLLLEAAL